MFLPQIGKIEHRLLTNGVKKLICISKSVVKKIWEDPYCPVTSILLQQFIQIQVGN